MNHYIATAMATLILPLLCSIQTKAEQNPTPFKLPAAHIESFTAASGVSGDAINALQAFSPFATAEIEEPSFDSDLIGQMTDYAAKFIGTRYRRGAAGPSAFDCSGFVGYVFKKFGFNLSRSSRSQYAEGERVSREDLRPGDLLFFSGRSAKSKTVGHVAMVVDVNADGSCTFIHASISQGVTYQRFPDGGYYSKRFIGAKRIIGVNSPTA